MTTVISVNLNKGGTGKTTTTANLGAALALAGASVVMFDTDLQGDLTKTVGLDPIHDQFYHLIAGQGGIGDYLTHVPAEFIGREAEFYIVTGGLRSQFLISQEKTVESMRHHIESLRDIVDVVLIDTAPGFGFVHLGAFRASDWLLLPTLCADNSVRSVQQTIDALTESTREGGAQVLGVLPTAYDQKKRVQADQMRALNILYGYRNWLLNPVRSSTAFDEANTRKLSIYEHLERVNERSNGQRYDRRAAVQAVQWFDEAIADIVKGMVTEKAGAA